MKKLLTEFTAALIICASLSVSVSAVIPVTDDFGAAPETVQGGEYYGSDPDTDGYEDVYPETVLEGEEYYDSYCTVNGDFESIDFSGRLYLEFDLGKAHLGGEDYVELKCRFSDISVRDGYSYTEVYYFREYPYILCVGLSTDDGDYERRYYARESALDGVKAAVSGEDFDGYLTRSSNYGVADLRIPRSRIDGWLETDQVSVVPANTYEDLDEYTLFAADQGGAVRREIGKILRDESFSEGGKDIYYLLYYPDYDRSYFYSDGGFALDSDETARFYVLSDESFAAELSEYYDIMAADDLVWMAEGLLPDELVFALTLIVFVLLPLAAIVFSVTVAVRTGRRNPYALPLAVLSVSSLCVIIGYTVILMQIF